MFFAAFVVKQDALLQGIADDVVGDFGGGRVPDCCAESGWQFSQYVVAGAAGVAAV